MTATANDLALVRATPAQAWEVLRLRNACADDLTRRHGVGPWSAHGQLEAVQRQAREKHTFLARIGGRSVATMTLSTQRPRVHRLEWFAVPDAPACYLTGLYVLPSAQRRGIGAWMIADAERIARAWDCVALRFDAYLGDGGASAFYRRLGYASRGEVDVAGVGLEVFERLL